MNALHWIPAAWAGIGLMFMTTAGTNWHGTILKETAFLDVDVTKKDVRQIFGMLTHAAFFIGELNWSIGVTHIMSLLGFSPAIAVTPAITMIASFVVMLKTMSMGPTGLPIRGPPFPIPHMALALGALVNINMLYQFFVAAEEEAIITDSTADLAPGYLDMKQNYRAVFFALFALVVGIPHSIAWYQRNVGLPDWRGHPVIRK